MSTPVTHPGAKLTAFQVIGCRARAAAGEPTEALAAEYDMGEEAMWEAVTGQTWTDVPGAFPCPRRH
jgi:hypothetical protein